MPRKLEYIAARGRQSLRYRRKLWIRLTLSISIVTGLFIMTVFAGMFVRNSKLIELQLLDRARAGFHYIVSTRAWVAMHGGVYVEKRPGVESNPWLEDPDVLTEDGRILTLRNPAAVTRELSELDTESDLLTFSITSDTPLNPGNVPDAFEMEALVGFRNGKPELYRIIESAEHTKFRYAAPLITQADCLACHGKQGYKVGDIRGTISVTYDITEIRESMRSNRLIIMGLCGISLIILVGTISYFIRRISKVLDKAHQRIAQLASTDELTRLPNRRAFFERMGDELERSKRYGHCLSCIMLDLDHFKKVNDTYGHKAGDMVLERVADVLAVVKRSSDMAARYGGEEMVVMLPETDCDGAATVAEKIRANIEDTHFDIGRTEHISLTVSLGVACACSTRLQEIAQPDDLLRLADKALYEAKDAGRNTVRVNRELLPPMKVQ